MTSDASHDSSFARLASVCQLPAGKVELTDTQGTGRGLAVASDVRAGQVIFSLPWSQALTPTGALEGLKRDEARKRGLLPRGILKLIEQLEGGDLAAEVAPGSEWTLFLALHVIRELRNPRSPWQAYARLLPAPPGSLLKHVCSQGPDATDLLLFSEGELEELQCRPLAEKVVAEKQRLESLHTRIFLDEGAKAVISRESFIWAHVLVRSRALDLTGIQREGVEGQAFHAHCLLPVVDLCNHGGDGRATCSLSVRLSPEGEPRWVNVIAARDLACGEELLLNYGDRPLQEFLQGYGFVPSSLQHEAFPEFGAKWESLYIKGSDQGQMNWFSSVHTSPAESDISAAISRQNSGPAFGQVSCEFVVRDETSARPKTMAHGPLLTMATTGAHSHSQMKVMTLEAEAEAVLARHIAEEVGLLLDSFPTSAAQDAKMLSELDCCNEAAVARVLCSRGSSVSSCEQRDEATCPDLLRVQGSGQSSGFSESHSTWFAKQHAIMAVQFRTFRKQLLTRVMTDMQTQAVFLQGAISYKL